jgi:hypothetical protein
MKIDIKTAITLGTLIFVVAGFYYTTISDLNSISLRIEALESENRVQQKRLDNQDKRINKLKKQVK